MGWELREELNSQPGLSRALGEGSSAVPRCPLPSPQTMAQFCPQSHCPFISIRSLWPNRQVEKLRQTHGQRTLFWVVDFCT